MFSLVDRISSLYQALKLYFDREENPVLQHVPTDQRMCGIPMTPPGMLGKMATGHGIGNDAYGGVFDRLQL